MNAEEGSHLGQISTDGEALELARRRDPGGWERLVRSYQKAIRRYLLKLLEDQAVPEVAAQEVADAILDKLLAGFPTYDRARGSFRHFLKRVLRNAAKNWKRDHGGDRPLELDPALLDDGEWPADAEDARLAAELRDKVLEHALQELHTYQRQNPASLAHTLLVLLQQQAPEEPSGPGYDQLAEKLREQTGHYFKAAALRQQVRRARKRFAGLVWRQVEQDLVHPTDAEVQEELCALGLWEHMRDYLGEEWQGTMG